MKKISIILTMLLFVCIAAVPLTAQDSWWLNRTIEDIKFEGLVHVSEEQLDHITDTYVGRELTNDQFRRIQNELYDLDFFDHFYARARRSEISDDHVILVFTMEELPFVESVAFQGNDELSDRDLAEIIQVGEGRFFQRSEFRNDPQLILQEYIQQGYADAEIQESVDIDEEAGTVSITYEISEGRQSRIQTISFDGNENFSDSTLKRQLTSKEQSLFHRGLFIENQIEEDIQAIKSFYQDRGYLDAEIEDVVVEREEETRRDRIGLSVTFVISEGSMWRFGGINITGNTLFTDEQLLEQTRLKPGDTLNLTRLQEDISNIAGVYFDEGYIYNDFRPQEIRDEDENTISFELLVVENDQAFIEDINIIGNERTKDHVIEREVTLQPGEVFSRSELIQSMRNLYNTGLFETVNIEPVYGREEGLIDLDVKVREANRIDLRFGATFGGAEEFPVSGFLEWNDKNFFGTGSDFSISLEASPSRQSLDFTYMENWLFGRRWSGGINFSLERRQRTNVLQDPYDIGVPYPYTSEADYEKSGGEDSIDDQYKMDYEELEIGLGLSTGYTFHTDIGRFNVGGGYSFTLSNIFYDEHYRPLEKSIRDNHEQWLYNNTAYLTTTWDRRDLVHRPTSGFMLHNRFTVSGGVMNVPFGFMGDEKATNYLKNQTRLEGHLSLFDIPRDEEEDLTGVLSAKSAFSFMFPQHTAEGFAERHHMLYIDGMNTARGWNFRPNLEVLWDNKLMVTMPLIRNVIDAEIYTSATWGHRPSTKGEGLQTMGDTFSLDNFQFSSGAGIKLGIPGLPIGLFLTKAYEFDEDMNINWEPEGVSQDLFGPLGLQLVFTIDYDLF